MSSLFDGVTQRPTATSAGPCDLPILYKDASLLSLSYLVDPAKAREHVAAGLTPWVVFGKAVVLVCVFEYRETSIGPYGEIGVGVLSHREGAHPSLLTAVRDLSRVPDAGLYVTNLPVSSEQARAAGVELWGYPKYVTGITTAFRDDGVSVHLEGDFELEMGRSGALRSDGVAIVTFSVKDGRFLRTAVEAEQRVRWGGARTVKLTLTGNGPTATTARALGLERQAPTLAYRCDRMRSILPLGVDAGEARKTG